MQNNEEVFVDFVSAFIKVMLHICIGHIMLSSIRLTT